MSQQLDTAYDLIKQGEIQAAIDILEPLIRDNRDNEDAWWLLANATNDNDAKRNALNNVIRLTDSDTRRDNAQSLLQSLNNDSYDFDTPSVPKMQAYEATDDTPQKSGGWSCARLSLIFVGLIGACACMTMIGAGALAGDFFSLISPPQDYVTQGQLVTGETYEGSLNSNQEDAVYSLLADGGDAVTLTVTTDSSTAPFLIIYDTTTNTIVTGTNGAQGGIYQPTTFSNTLTATFTPPRDGEYLVALRSVRLLGEELGVGNYTLEVE